MKFSIPGFSLSLLFGISGACGQATVFSSASTLTKGDAPPHAVPVVKKPCEDVSAIVIIKPEKTLNENIAVYYFDSETYYGIEQEFWAEASAGCSEEKISSKNAKKEIQKRQENYISRFLQKACPTKMIPAVLSQNIQKIRLSMQNHSPLPKNFAIPFALDKAKASEPSMVYNNENYKIVSCLIGKPPLKTLNNEAFTKENYLQDIATGNYDSKNADLKIIAPGLLEDYLAYLGFHEEGHCLGLDDAQAEKRAFLMMKDKNPEIVKAIASARIIRLLYSTEAEHGVNFYYSLQPLLNDMNSVSADKKDAENFFKDQISEERWGAIRAMIQPYMNKGRIVLISGLKNTLFSSGLSRPEKKIIIDILAAIQVISPDKKFMAVYLNKNALQNNSMLLKSGDDRYSVASLDL